MKKEEIDKMRSEIVQYAREQLEESRQLRRFQGLALKKCNGPDDLVYLADVIAREVKARIRDLNLEQKEYRRDYDGVSQTDFLLEKLVGEKLSGYGMKPQGLIECKDSVDEGVG